jgi:hypothetical protein
LANTTSSATTLTLSLTNLDGTIPAGLQPVTVQLSGSAQISKFLDELFPTLPTPFQGILRIVSSSSAVSVVGLRIHYNERGDFLLSTTPATNENAQPVRGELLFPQIVDGGGFTTEFILFNGFAGQSPSGSIQMYSPAGQPLALSLQ